ncbi:hypothetical protein VTN96DRAFT_2115 [Rasamsonia emersonii]
MLCLAPIRIGSTCLQQWGDQHSEAIIPHLYKMPRPSAKDPYTDSSSLESQSRLKKRTGYFRQLTWKQILLRGLISVLIGLTVGAIVGVIVRYA